jgi:hypothetical protein
MRFSKNLLIGIVTAILLATIISVISSTSALAQMGGGMGGSHDVGSMSEMGSSEGHMGGHALPGMVHEMCQPASGMPPHYCEPTYHTMSSVRGIRIATVDAVTDNEVVVSVKQIGTAAGQVTKKLVLVGGSGNLAGATIIDGGWSKSTVVHLKLEGIGTIYDFGQLSLHLFPYTAE